ncbi:restriction endonuclease subunit S [Peribacillus simplex]|uniref:restriction endonuclease subunit S n=1 Tax=Peribacillus simplex TaxID=1478 RepID=UPI003D279D2B
MNAKDLKGAILQYAIQGKLVVQNPNAESATVLLEKIKQDKENLIARGEIKKEKPQSAIIESALPFKIPDSWTWVRLGDICYKINDGTHSTPKYIETGIPFLSVKDMSNGVLSFDNTKFISEEDHEVLYKRCNPELGDILLTKVGTTGVPVVVDTEVPFSLFVSVALIKFNQELIYNKYLSYLLQSPFVYKQSQDGTRGVGNKNLVIRVIKDFLLPIPPLEEQYRIVERIESFKEKVIIYDHVYRDLMSLQKELPNRLEKSILQYAMQGRLIEQVETDEHAIQLIERIKAEKERLVKEKVIKREKALPEITEDEIPFEIPSSWEWVRVKDVCLVNPKNNASDEMDAAFIPMKLIDDGFVDKHHFEIRKWGDIKKGFTHFQSGDVVVAKITPCFENRKSAVLLDLPNDIGAGTTELYVIRPIENMIYNEFLLWLFKTNHFISNGVATYTGTAGQQRVSKLFIENYLIPLPPYEEQLRIVEAIKKMNIQLEYLSRG